MIEAIKCHPLWHTHALVVHDQLFGPFKLSTFVQTGLKVFLPIFLHSAEASETKIRLHYIIASTCRARWWPHPRGSRDSKNGYWVDKFFWPWADPPCPLLLYREGVSHPWHRAICSGSSRLLCSAQLSCQNSPVFNTTWCLHQLSSRTTSPPSCTLSQPTTTLAPCPSPHLPHPVLQPIFSTTPKLMQEILNLDRALLAEIIW